MEGVPAELRRMRILELLENRSFVRVADLRDEFGLSGVTIRNDLDALAADGTLVRVHGGAIPIHSPVRRERPFEEVLGERGSEKASIGRAVAALVGSGDTLFLDVGTTTTAIAQALVQRTDVEDVVVLTSGLTTALELEPAIPRITVVVTGGTLRPLQHSLVDPLAHHMFADVRADLAVIGANGVHITAGVTNVNIPESAIKTRMVHAADRCIVAADGSKIGARSVSKICDLQDVQLIVTSRSAPPGAVDELRQRTDVEVAE